MAEQSSWVPEGVNVDLPSAARVYDYLLGGGHNFAADRELAERFAAALPGSRDIARLNRAFLRRAVLFMVERGVDQFLDIGSGIPTVGNVHEIAQAANPDARVVYVDNEPVAVAHSQLILAGNGRAAALQEDLRRPEAILDHPTTRELLDFDRPIGLLMVGVFHFVPDEWGPRDLLDRFRSRLAPGSHLALSHFTADTRPDEMAAMVEVMSRSKDPIHPRSRAEVEALFTGFDLVEPGVVSTADWRPVSPGDGAEGPEREQIYAGVGRLP
ncbi:SAM-dependent methyltransferase [Streptoalloteichus tenebrarius]|uniref:SAM-dependent methyltransferase n=1 Tax=Streptoalloteichus tenebrarius (strain ATCC 17920 / DSM 40477 / JCM 4838 / CBS 697.72 / NBRC 16177 / NCIMB 11028 / NRRL B-12390 / A12253. 1 / ISP 5477) TaxID=1933 RepID=UPI0020A42F20|nr:SAM-dependent methyltransferase [Streptoalloteichus tenebrarius]BFF02959.1 SAM-dependent methyltransferase [Streptoalloteichus tenebrarius]